MDTRIPETNREAIGDSMLGWYVTNEGDLLEMRVWNVEDHDKIVVNFNAHDWDQLASVDTYVTATKDVNFFLYDHKPRAIIAALHRLNAASQHYVEEGMALVAKSNRLVDEYNRLTGEGVGK